MLKYIELHFSQTSTTNDTEGIPWVCSWQVNLPPNVPTWDPPTEIAGLMIRVYEKSLVSRLNKAGY